VGARRYSRAMADGPVFRYHAFVSHNRAQKDWVRRLVAALRSEGLRVFFDEDSIKLGEDVVAAIEQGLRSSRHVVLIMSSEALASRWVEMEWSMSIYRDPSAASRFILPVLRDDCALPLHLARLNHLDARNDDFTGQLRRLIAALDRDLVLEPMPPNASRDVSHEPTSYLLTGGALPPGAANYVERNVDRELSRLLSHPERGSTVLLVGARQTGKSSLLARISAHFRQHNIGSAFVDFSYVGGVTGPQLWYNLGVIIAEQLLHTFPPSERFERTNSCSPSDFVRFLKSSPQPLVLLFDEVDYLRSIGLLEEFFVVMRAIDQHADEVFHLVGGQPYLTCCAAVSLAQGLDPKSIALSATQESGPFALHLDMMRAFIQFNPSARDALTDFIKQSGAGPVRFFSDLDPRPGLRALVEVGLLTAEGGRLSFSCTVYEQFCLSLTRAGS